MTQQEFNGRITDNWFSIVTVSAILALGIAWGVQTSRTSRLIEDQDSFAEAAASRELRLRQIESVLAAQVEINKSSIQAALQAQSLQTDINREILNTLTSIKDELRDLRTKR